MNKKLLLIVLVSLLLVSIIAPNVFAQAEGQGIGHSLYKALGWLKIDISVLGGTTDEAAQATFIARFLIWIAVFAILFFVAHTVLFKGQRNISIALAAVLSLIGVVALPDGIIKAIFQSYSLFFAIAFLALPIIGTLLLKNLMGKTFDKHPVAGRAFNVIAFFLLAVLLGSLNSAMAGGFSYLIPPKTLGDYVGWVAAAQGIAIFFGLWNLMALVLALFGMGKAVETAAGHVTERAEKAAEGLSGEKAEERAAIKAEMAELKLEFEEMKFLKEAERLLYNKKGAEAKTLLERSSALANRLTRIDAYVDVISAHLAKIERGSARILEADVFAVQKNIQTLTKDVQGLIDKAIGKAKKNPQTGARPLVLQAIKIEEKEIIPMTKKLTVLSTKAYQMT
jgi:hypothetical protein